MPPVSASTSGVARNLTIDRLRGSLVVLMVIGDFISGVSAVPSFLKHMPDLGLAIADTVAPAFVFVIGLNFGPSYRRRMRDGLRAANQYFVLRYLAFIGIGAIIAGGGNMVGQPSDWGVLQAIGVAGLIGLAFIRLPIWARFLAGALLLCGYQYLLEISMLDTVLNSVHGGLFGAVSWGALLVISTAIADVWRQGTLRYGICCVCLIVSATVSAVLVPVSKHRVSLSFILITLALIATVFLVVEFLSRNHQKRAGILSWWGQHALALYLVHLVLLGVFVTPAIDWWYVDAPIWLVALQLAVILGLMSLGAWWLNERTAKGRGKTKFSRPQAVG